MLNLGPDPDARARIWSAGSESVGTDGVAEGLALTMALSGSSA